MEALIGKVSPADVMTCIEIGSDVSDSEPHYFFLKIFSKLKDVVCWYWTYLEL